MDSDPIARILYERILKNLPDMMIDGQSIHRISLISLLEGDSPPYKKAHWYGEFIRRFPEADEVGPYHFLLAKEYEKLGLWPQAIEEYRQFLPFLVYLFLDIRTPTIMRAKWSNSTIAQRIGHTPI